MSTASSLTSLFHRRLEELVLSSSQTAAGIAEVSRNTAALAAAVVPKHIAQPAPAITCLAALNAIEDKVIDVKSKNVEEINKKLEIA